MEPRSPKIAPRPSKSAQDGPKVVPTGSQEPPRSPEDGPKIAFEALRSLQDRRRNTPRCPKITKLTVAKSTSKVAKSSFGVSLLIETVSLC